MGQTFSRLQHPFGKYAITLGRVIDKDMGNGTHQFSPLDNGAATHALNNPAGLPYKFRIGDPDDHSFITGPGLGKDPLDLHGKAFNPFTG